MRIVDYPIAVIVWTQQGCPACSDYLPKFMRVADRYKACIPSFVVDSDSHARAANLYRIRETPTTMISRYGRPSLYRLSGDASPAQIEGLYAYAMHGQACEIG